MKKKGKRFLSVMLCCTLSFSGSNGLAMAAVPGIAAGTLEDSRQLWLHFNNEDCKDYSVNHLSTSAVGEVSYETGYDGTGRALVLDAPGQKYINLGKSTEIQSPQITFSAWVKAPKGGFNGEQVLLWCKPAACWHGAGYYISLNADAGVYVNVGKGVDGDAGNGMRKVKSTLGSKEFFPEEEWVHLAVTIDSDTNEVCIYRNGRKQSTNDIDNTKQTIEKDSENDKYLGASGYGNGIAAVIDDVAIYDVAASQAEIFELAGISAEDRIKGDLESIFVAKNVSEDFELPVQGDYGTTISWESSHPGIRIENGKAIITRGERDIVGTLTVTAQADGKKDSKEIEVTVKAAEQMNTQSVDFTQVHITDKFWAARQKQVICSILKVGIGKVEAANGGFQNFVEASKKNRGEAAKPFEGDVYFLDSDAYKMIEAMSYGLQIEAGGDQEILQAQEEIRKTLNKWIPYIEGAQEEDGYLDTFFTLDRGSQHMSAGTAELNRWTDFAAHELYVDGHFYEAAVALYRANGDIRLLDVAVKNADLVNQLFGEGGSIKATSGHQEIELALVKLAAACQEAEANGAEGNYTGHYGEKSNDYVALAKRFLDLRGDYTDRTGYYSFGANNPEYRQDHKRVSEQTEAVGHVVRAMYQYIAMTDVALLTDSYAYDEALTSLWEDITEKKSYITGGMGIVNHDESFGGAYELPVNGAYSETCGSIGSVMWNYRMNMLYGDTKYIDILEKTLYNAVISGVNFDGDKFFYQNPISSDGSVERSAWFGCACCPPNLMRLINSLGGYIYTQDENGINVNLYIGNQAEFKYGENNETIGLVMDSDMPWDGNVSMTVETDSAQNFELRFRVPEWAGKTYSISVNGQKADAEVNAQGYAVLNRTWNSGDKISIVFEMPIVRTYQSDEVKDTIGYTAVKKGPIVYAAEAADNDFDLNLFTLPKTAELTAEYTENLTGGEDPYGIKGGLRIRATGVQQTISGEKEQEIVLIPYYAWNNRGKGIMRTYLNESNEEEYGLESFAKADASYTSVWQSLGSINDRDDNTFWCSWIQGDVKRNPWVSYEFDTEVMLSGCHVNWMADTAGVRVPGGLLIEYWDGENWKEVSHSQEYNTFAAGQYNEYKFDPVKTTKIRMTLNNTTIGSTAYALGIYEWKLEGSVAEPESPDSGNKEPENPNSGNEDSGNLDSNNQTDGVKLEDKDSSIVSDKETSPDTGDGRPYEAWMAGMMASAAGLAAVSRKKRKKDSEN